MDIVAATKTIEPGMVVEMYRRGIFPMGDTEHTAITWHRPERRGILPLEALHVSRSLERLMRQGRYEVTVDKAFGEVMRGCARRETTWITAPVLAAYEALHREGKAHSLEVWVEGMLGGGVYGVHLGGAFFAESKFHRVRDMSKVALAHLAVRLRERGLGLLDVQYWTPHLAQFGVVEVERAEYERRLGRALRMECEFG